MAQNELSHIGSIAYNLDRYQSSIDDLTRNIARLESLIDALEGTGEDSEKGVFRAMPDGIIDRMEAQNDILQPLTEKQAYLIDKLGTLIGVEPKG